MELGIKGKRALVCAASRGLGKAIALSLAAEGAHLFLCARDKDALSQVAREAEQSSGNPVYFQTADLSHDRSRQSLIDEVMSAWQGVDILIHNTGGPPSSSAEETTLAEWEAGFHQLFQSTAHLNCAFVPAMKERRWGRICAVTSSSVLEPIASLAVSNAIRSAVTSMMKTLADELAPYGVTVNCIAPGMIYTDRTEERLSALAAKGKGTKDEIMANWTKAIPAGRLGTPKEYADAVAFLCSQNASYITGSTICVDGGKRRSTY